MQHAELYWMPYLLWLFGADVDPRHVYPTEWVFVYEIPSKAITLNTLQGFRTGGITVSIEQNSHEPEKTAFPHKSSVAAYIHAHGQQVLKFQEVQG
jgi:hypothetical protein